MSDIDLLAIALSYHESGLAIIPIRDGGKIPANSNWSTTKLTQAELTGWFAKENITGIGAVCGSMSGNRICLDFDAGWEYSFEAFMAAWPELANAPIVKTAHGRRQLWLIVPDLPKSVTKEIYTRDGAIIELRANGHQCLLPPSLHKWCKECGPDSVNSRYEWLTDEADWLEVRISDLRAWLAEWGTLKSGKSDIIQNTLAAAPELPNNGVAPLPQKTLEFLATPGPLPAGDRNDKLYQHSLQAAAAGYELEQAVELLAPVAKRIGLDEAEIEPTIRSGFDLAKREKFTPAAYTIEVPTAADPESPFRPMTFEELANMPAKPWLVSGLIGKNDIGMVFGDAGKGKTFLVIDLLLAAIRGGMFAGWFVIDEPLFVAYCAGEGLGGLASRFRAGAKHYALEPDTLDRITVFDDVPQLFNGRALTSTAAFVECYKALGKPLDLIVIDTLHNAAVGGEENSAKDAGIISASLRYASRALNCAVIVVHHANKAGTDLRGSSAYSAMMDSIIEVSQNGQDGYKMYCSKLKDAERFKTMKFDLARLDDSAVVEWLGPLDVGPAQSAGVTDLLREYSGLTAKEIAEVLGMSQGAMINILTRMANNGEIVRGLRDQDKPKSNWNPWVYSL